MPSEPVNFFTLRKLVNERKLDGLIIAEIDPAVVTQIVKVCQFYEISNIGCLMNNNSFESIYWLNTSKTFLYSLETNLIDSCNLNCKACSHFSNLFDDECFYSLENFKRDVRQLSECADLVNFYLLGGEPFKLKNLDEYIEIARDFLPHTNLCVVTNGLLLQSTSQEILDSLRENKIQLEITLYPPTEKIADKISDILEKNQIPFNFRPKVTYFNSFLTLRGGHNPIRARAVCHSDVCRFLRDGKIYKCPVDALSFQLVKKFGIKNFPRAVGVDIYAKNFNLMFEQLNGNVELCFWCNEIVRPVDWQVERKPKLSDWVIE